MDVILEATTQIGLTESFDIYTKTNAKSAVKSAYGVCLLSALEGAPKKSAEDDRRARLGLALLGCFSRKRSLHAHGVRGATLVAASGFE